jgi:hypothetical protein
MRTGSVITGTLRRQDLIPAFIDELAIVAPDAFLQLMSGMFSPVPNYVYDEGDESEWWDSDDAGYLLDSLFDELDQHAPDGYYFGSHPGDGADFGFFEYEI